LRATWSHSSTYREGASSLQVLSGTAAVHWRFTVAAACSYRRLWSGLLHAGGCTPVDRIRGSTRHQRATSASKNLILAGADLDLLRCSSAPTRYPRVRLALFSVRRARFVTSCTASRRGWAKTSFLVGELPRAGDNMSGDATSRLRLVCRFTSITACVQHVERRCYSVQAKSLGISSVMWTRRAQLGLGATTVHPGTNGG